MSSHVCWRRGLGWRALGSPGDLPRGFMQQLTLGRVWGSQAQGLAGGKDLPGLWSPPSSPSPAGIFHLFAFCVAG